MPINAGDRYNTLTLTADQVGAETQSKSSSGLLSIFRTLITIVEVGVAFIPGIGAPTELAIGLGAGALQETLDFVSGTASIQNTLINFASPIAGYRATTRINQALVKRAIRGAEGIEDATSALFKAGLRGEEIANQLIEAGLIQSVDELNNVNRVARLIRNTNITRRQAKSYGLVQFEKQTTSSLTKKEIREGLSTLRRNYKRLNNFSISFNESYKAQKRILRTIGFTDQEITPFLKLINGTNMTNEARFSATLGFLREARVLTDERTKYKVFIKALNKGQIALNEAYQIPLARQLTRLANKNFPAQALTTNSKQASSVLKEMINVAKHPGSAKFNDYIVQPTQAIFDPNDLGRAPVEYLYRTLKKSFKKQLSKVKVVAKQARNIEDLFTRTGGIVVDSDWHLGYRIIQRNPVHNFVQITYGKDTGKLRQVYVFATDHQLEKYRRSPGGYYLNHWAYSKGGARLNLTGAFGGKFSKGELNQIQGALSFIPNTALRNIFSLTSNVVENTWNMANGDYFDTWTTKFKSSLQRNSINRTFRLAGRVIAGGVAGKYLGKRVGDTIGRELQRLGTNVFAPTINTAIINAGRRARGLKPLKSPLTKTKLVNASLKGVLSNARRALRTKRGNTSVILNTLTAQRKLKIIGRLPNTILPGRPYKGGRFPKTKLYRK